MPTGQIAILAAALRVICKAHPELREELVREFDSVRMDVHGDREQAVILARRFFGE